MISIEQWRARIGTFNCKRGYSGFLSSLFSSSSYYYYQPRKRRNSLSRKNEDCSAAEVSPSSASLSTGDHSETTSTDHFTVSSSSAHESTAAITHTTTISSSLSSGVFPLRLSLLRDVLITGILLIAIISQQLIISGDIETNPGPVACEYDWSSS